VSAVVHEPSHRRLRAEAGLCVADTGLVGCALRTLSLCPELPGLGWPDLAPTSMR